MERTRRLSRRSRVSDRMTTGMQKGDLVIVAGRPSMGKTSLAMNIAEHAAIRHDVPVAVFSMEMSALQLTMRLFSSLGQIEQGRPLRRCQAGPAVPVGVEAAQSPPAAAPRSS